ncbi:hypothetical protein Mcup_1096 [Metallosphaera cuprina Ar-4]|uniref:Uncharacterized protein n=1 Tax=Metallosphaera cuprina (strain Ar-4) TaxID=1006006 RepID=F4G303_METCR|nr:hypothetical protein Mcup_1096 [Metallosphaera cuprina Ar-4]
MGHKSFQLHEGFYLKDIKYISTIKDGTFNSMKDSTVLILTEVN